MNHIKIRDAQAQDLNFIMNSWLISAQQDHDMPRAQFFTTYRDHIEALLSRSKITVAVDPTDTSFVIGYIVSQHIRGTPLLHWAYVKAPFRKLGVMRDLIKSLGHKYGTDPLIITYKNDKRPRMLLRIKAVYKPQFRSLSGESEKSPA